MRASSHQDPPGRRARSRLVLRMVLPRPMNASLRVPLLVTFMSLVLVAVGFWAGRRTALGGLKQLVASWKQGERLDFVIGDQDKDTFARAYLDPVKARQELATYSWMPPNTMTPFVMHMPVPGRSANATIGLMQCRGKQEWLPPKANGTLRVLMTGGSTLYGSGAPSDDATIAALLEKELSRDARLGGRPVEVHAFAVPGWATTHERIAIENRIADLAPDLVVSFSGVNDIRWATQDRNVLWMRSFSDQHWFDLQNAVLGLVGDEPHKDYALPEPSRPTPDTVANRLARNVELAKCALGRQSIPYLWVLQPMLQLTKKTLSARERRWLEGAGEVPYYTQCAAAIRARFTSLAAALPKLVDLTPLFDASGADEELFLDSVHFGDRGNTALARALAPEVAALLVGK